MITGLRHVTWTWTGTGTHLLLLCVRREAGRRKLGQISVHIHVFFFPRSAACGPAALLAIPLWTLSALAAGSIASALLSCLGVTRNDRQLSQRNSRKGQYQSSPTQWLADDYLVQNLCVHVTAGQAGSPSMSHASGRSLVNSDYLRSFSKPVAWILSAVFQHCAAVLWTPAQLARCWPCLAGPSIVGATVIRREAS